MQKLQIPTPEIPTSPFLDAEIPVFAADEAMEDLQKVTVQIPSAMKALLMTEASRRQQSVSVIARILLAERLGYSLPPTLVTGKRARKWMSKSEGERARRKSKKSRLQQVMEEYAQMPPRSSYADDDATRDAVHADSP